ncbi:unnamed protein product [Amoebophrya sp. A120]|nr:unnamed protein product [Amoebophrya sp. A120]|eukprot:GSA120T00007448001.1
MTDDEIMKLGDEVEDENGRAVSASMRTVARYKRLNSNPGIEQNNTSASSCATASIAGGGATSTSGSSGVHLGGGPSASTIPGMGPRKSTMRGTNKATQIKNAAAGAPETKSASLENDFCPSPGAAPVEELTTVVDHTLGVVPLIGKTPSLAGRVSICVPNQSAAPAASPGPPPPGVVLSSGETSSSYNSQNINSQAQKRSSVLTRAGQSDMLRRPSILKKTTDPIRSFRSGSMFQSFSRNASLLPSHFGGDKYNNDGGGGSSFGSASEFHSDGKTGKSSSGRGSEPGGSCSSSSLSHKQKRPLVTSAIIHTEELLPLLEAFHERAEDNSEELCGGSWQDYFATYGSEVAIPGSPANAVFAQNQKLAQVRKARFDFRGKRVSMINNALLGGTGSIGANLLHSGSSDNHASASRSTDNAPVSKQNGLARQSLVTNALVNFNRGRGGGPGGHNSSGYSEEDWTQAGGRTGASGQDQDLNSMLRLHNMLKKQEEEMEEERNYFLKQLKVETASLQDLKTLLKKYYTTTTRSTSSSTSSTTAGSSGSTSSLGKNYGPQQFGASPNKAHSGSTASFHPSGGSNGANSTSSSSAKTSGAGAGGGPASFGRRITLRTVAELLVMFGVLPNALHEIRALEELARLVAADACSKNRDSSCTSSKNNLPQEHFSSTMLTTDRNKAGDENYGTSRSSYKSQQSRWSNYKTGTRPNKQNYNGHHHLQDQQQLFTFDQFMTLIALIRKWKRSQREMRFYLAFANNELDFFFQKSVPRVLDRIFSVVPKSRNEQQTLILVLNQEWPESEVAVCKRDFLNVCHLVAERMESVRVRTEMEKYCSMGGLFFSPSGRGPLAGRAAQQHTGTTSPTSVANLHSGKMLASSITNKHTAGIYSGLPQLSTSTSASSGAPASSSNPVLAARRDFLQARSAFIHQLITLNRYENSYTGSFALLHPGGVVSDLEPWPDLHGHQGRGAGDHHFSSYHHHHHHHHHHTPFNYKTASANCSEVLLSANEVETTMELAGVVVSQNIGTDGSGAEKIKNRPRISAMAAAGGVANRPGCRVKDATATGGNDSSQFYFRSDEDIPFEMNLYRFLDLVSQKL